MRRIVVKRKEAPAPDTDNGTERPVTLGIDPAVEESDRTVTPLPEVPSSNVIRTGGTYTASERAIDTIVTDRTPVPTPRMNTWSSQVRIPAFSFTMREIAIDRDIRNMTLVVALVFDIQGQRHVMQFDLPDMALQNSTDPSVVRSRIEDWLTSQLYSMVDDVVAPPIVTLIGQALAGYRR